MSIQAQDLLDLYNRVMEGHGHLPQMDPGTCDLAIPDPQRLTSAAEALDHLKAFDKATGWIGFQSANRHFTGQVPAMDETTGILLNAEAAGTDGNASLHIRYDGAGGWIATEYRQAPGGSYLSDNVTHIAHDPKLRKLRYRRYWCIDAEQGAMVHAARFVGFGDETRDRD